MPIGIGFALHSPIYLKRRNVIQRHTIIDKCEYRLRRIIRSYGNALAYRASLHYKSFALYVTLADWLWQRARANHPTFLPVCVCVRMAAPAQYSVCESAWTIIYM